MAPQGGGLRRRHEGQGAACVRPPTTSLYFPHIPLSLSLSLTILFHSLSSFSSQNPQASPETLHYSQTLNSLLLSETALHGFSPSPSTLPLSLLDPFSKHNSQPLPLGPLSLQSTLSFSRTTLSPPLGLLSLPQQQHHLSHSLTTPRFSLPSLIAVLSLFPSQQLPLSLDHLSPQ